MAIICVWVAADNALQAMRSQRFWNSGKKQHSNSHDALPMINIQKMQIISIDCAIIETVKENIDDVYMIFK